MQTILLFLIGVLLLVWPMPHSIAIRNIDIGLLFLISSVFYIKNKNQINFDKQIKIIGILSISFIIWAIFISSVSEYRDYCFSELKQFIMPILLIFISYFLINSKIDKNKIFITIFSMLFIFVLYHSLYSFHYFLIHHHLPFRSFGITVGLDELNFMMPYLLAFFTVEIIFRISKMKSLLPISNSFLGILFFITIFSLIVQAKRNGIISIVFMVFSISFIIYLVNKKNLSKKVILFLMSGFLFVGIMAYINYKDDSRWKSFGETFKIVFINDDMSDLYGKLPKLSNGQRADQSNYKRLFMIRESLKMIKNNPLGYGYGRTIYGRILSQEYKKYGVHSRTHSHSGVLDLTIGTGIIGFILWSAIMFLIMYVGFKAFLNYRSYYGLLAFFLTTSFYFRMFLDSINKDHMLQQFVFFVSLALFMMQRDLNAKNNIPSS